MSDPTMLFHALAEDDTPIEVWTWDTGNVDQFYLTVGQHDVRLPHAPSPGFLIELAVLLRKAA